MGAALDLLDSAVMVACIVLLAVIAATVSWQVVARYVTASASAWAAEAATLAFVWLAMFAIALGVRRSRHMVLDIWEYLPVPGWVRIAVDTVAALVVWAVLAAFTWYGIQGLETSFRRAMPGLGISFGWNALAVPVGSSLALLFAVEAGWRDLRAGGRAPAISADVSSEDAVDRPDGPAVPPDSAPSSPTSPRER